MKQANIKYANLYLWSDVHPYEIIKWCTDKKILVRPMAVLPKGQGKLKWIKGGFAGHCVNQNDQEWEYKSDLTRDTYACRLHNDGNWYSIFGRHILQETPVKFHDYNF